MHAPWPMDRVQLKAAHCWFDVDRVSRRPDVTEFRRRARWQQAWWRERAGLPIGSYAAGRPRTDRPNGSRIEHAAARRTGANFLSEQIREAVVARIDRPERHQTLDERRLWTDCLSSMPMCFNLFGEVANDQERASTAVDAIWPDHPGTPAEVRFEWSPGRADPAYLGNRTAYDAAILLALDGGGRGVIGIETKYHEHIAKERKPDEQTRLPRYREVTERSGMFGEGWESAVVGTDLQQIWLDHLLVLSMLQHPDDTWTWGRFVIVHPAGSTDFADACARYRQLLIDQSTFAAVTIEDLLDAGALPAATTAALRDRYLPR